MRTILLTGFEPFGGDSGNPSGDAVRDVAVRWDGDGELVSAVLPVEFDAADREVRGLIRELRPDVVIATGLAGGRTVITPERVADSRQQRCAAHR
jgi:pyroglutamyl-peptidase